MTKEEINEFIEDGSIKLISISVKQLIILNRKISANSELK